MSYDQCHRCGEMAFKTNGEGKWVCYNMAFFGTCEKPKPKPAVKAFKLPGRNEKCLCGSGKKYKHCCLK